MGVDGPTRVPPVDRGRRLGGGSRADDAPDCHTLCIYSGARTRRTERWRAPRRPEEARALVAAVRAALHDAKPSLSGRRLVNLRVPYADVFAGADRETTLGIVRVRAVTEAS